MKKSIKFSSVFIFLLYCAAIPAQVTLTEGKISDHSKNSEVEKLIGADESGFYVLRVERNFKSTYFFAEKYNKTTSDLIYSTKLNLDEAKSANPHSESFRYFPLLVNKKIHFLFEGYADKGNDRLLFMISVQEDGKLSGVPTETYRSSNGYFDVSVSPDNNNMLIVSKFQQKAKLYKINGFSTIWEKEIAKNFNGAEISVSKYMTDNAGNLIYYFYYTKDNKDVDAIGIIKNTEKEPKVIPLKNELNATLNVPLLKYTNSGKLIGTGAYVTEKGSGIYYFNIDLTKAELLFGDSKPFTKDLASNLNYVSAKGFDPANKRYESTALEEINSNYYFVTEFSHDNTQSLGFNNLSKTGFNNVNGNGNLGSGGKTTYYDYMKQDVLISKINSSTNKIEWTQLLPKFVSNSVGGMDVKLDNINGTYLLASDKKLNIVYLENTDVEEKIIKGKKFDLDDMPYVKASKGANVVCYEIDENKNVKRSIIYTNKEMDCRPITGSNNVYLTAGKSVLVYMLRGKSESFGTLNVK